MCICTNFVQEAKSICVKICLCRICIFLCFVLYCYIYYLYCLLIPGYWRCVAHNLKISALGSPLRFPIDVTYDDTVAYESTSYVFYKFK